MNIRSNRVALSSAHDSIQSSATTSGIRAAFEARHEFGNFEANLCFLHRAVALKQSQNILEIGSGKGGLIQYLLQSGCNVRGIDIDESYVNESKTLHGPLPIYLMSGEELGFKDSTFDIVLSFDVFEHIRNSDVHLREVKRVLKSRGSYLLQTPNKLTNVVFETIRNRTFIEWRQDHCSLHTYWQLTDRFRHNGFHVSFFDIPVVTKFFKSKIQAHLGKPGLFLLNVINPDRLPLYLRTNFYIKAQKID
jgi:SAM-dependent methyltransferase